MRSLGTFAVLAGLVAAAVAEDPKPASEKTAEPKKVVPAPKVVRPEPTLKVGDPAPPLKADKWLQGDEVTKLGGGKVHVVEFWATWCGPCIVMMPHMSELQAEYRDKGVTIVGFSSKDRTNTAEKVAAFVAKRGPRLGYTFAFEDGRDTNDAWMRAAGQNGIPCCFVVDRAGKVAYVGHPMYLGLVLPKVVSGSWTESDAKALDAADEDVTAVFKALNGDPEAALKAVADFEAKYPAMADVPYFRAGRLNALLKLKRFGDAAAAAKAMVAKAVKQADPPALGTVSVVARSPLAAKDKGLLAVSVAAADALLALNGDADVAALMNASQAAAAAGDDAKAKAHARKAAPVAEKELRDDTDATGMLKVADAHLAAGDPAAAKSWAEKAVAAASPQLKRYVEQQAKKFLGDEPKKDEEKK